MVRNSPREEKFKWESQKSGVPLAEVWIFIIAFRIFSQLELIRLFDCFSTWVISFPHCPFPHFPAIFCLRK